jgi:hypothetical protein
LQLWFLRQFDLVLFQVPVVKQLLQYMRSVGVLVRRLRLLWRRGMLAVLDARASETDKCEGLPRFAVPG